MMEMETLDLKVMMAREVMLVAIAKAEQGRKELACHYLRTAIDILEDAVLLEREIEGEEP